MIKRKRLPPWLRRRLPCCGNAQGTAQTLDSFQLATVCQSARCPNTSECFSKGTATFMIMGDICTRNCGFCAVSSGDPGPLDSGEPGRVAAAAEKLGLKHVVITSVTRDDLDDGGAAHFAATVKAVRRTLSGSTIEVLVPDFLGDKTAILTVIETSPDVFNHNLETVPRLYQTVRPEAEYRRSLELLRFAADASPDMRIKSGIMLGLGETEDEVMTVFHDLRDSGCEMLTVGQYLRPSTDNLPVEEFIPPEDFEEYKQMAHSMGFISAYCGPFVRSSYNAGEFVEKKF